MIARNLDCNRILEKGISNTLLVKRVLFFRRQLVFYQSKESARLERTFQMATLERLKQVVATPEQIEQARKAEKYGKVEELVATYGLLRGINSPIVAHEANATTSISGNSSCTSPSSPAMLLFPHALGTHPKI